MDVTPVSLQGDDEFLHIGWSDGVAHRLTWRLLRDRCPCAVCRDLHTRQAPTEAAPAESVLLPVLSPEEARPLRVRSMKPVGNYAYGIDFTDGHTSGIYSLEYLRELGDEATRDDSRPK